MAPNKTRTIKNKHAGSKSSVGAPGKGGAKRSATDGVSKSKKPKGPVVSQQVKEKNRALLMRRPKKKSYTAEELGIPTLNMITPIGVEKPKGKKKGKVFVDDKESMTTILSLVQAEKEGHIESKMIKARQMEEIREARKVEADKKAAERKAKLEDTKESLRKKRKRKSDSGEDNLKSISLTGSKASKASKKRVSFA
ncbi:60s ribosomal subunit assembly export loc1 [Trichoderma arundinaceum]|uniref:60s ribosomal subunit assembly export loc1 n=1 Tax=Trichoderma arundinaceum TaxID=490622 RepID=A0A395NBR7_TRIAR|nr:60s ribosomal subunit assembly export loc1 [Trichoderma arundinaceum]